MDPETTASRSARRAAATSSTRRAPKAGRNLPAAIGIGILLGAIALGSLFLSPEVFVGVVTIAVVLGVWELSKALALVHHRIPLFPVMLGAVIMVWTAWFRGPEVLTVATVLTASAVVVWRVADGLENAAGDIAAGILTVFYPAFLASFAVLLLAQPQGELRVVTFLLVTVCSDVGGYAAGVLYGRRPLAPTLSPKKSWEGLAGSVGLAMVGGLVAVVALLGGPWWAGLLLGAAGAVSATVGDLIESSIKRDTGLKDMSHLLPGHGGAMDRLDSLLVTAPVVWAILRYLVPAG